MRNGVARTTLAGLLLFSASGSFAGVTEHARLPATRLPAVDRGEVVLEALAGKKGTVLVFLSTECPLSNGYLPTLERMAEQYREKGIEFVGVNPNDGQSLRDISLHRRDFGFAFEVVKDAGAKIAAALGATHCPEACLFDGSGRLRYRGRIDDRYVRRGGAPRNVRSHDLKDAIEAVLAGRPVSVERTTPVGCPITVKPAEGTTRARGPSFNRDVAPILQKRCQECHRPGGVAPFSLVTYEQALSWAEDIRAYTQDGTMPPWKPTPGFGHFRDPRTMPKEEIETLAKWVDAGCVQGAPGDLPPPVPFPEGWRLGTPDLVLEPSEEYTLAADGDDVYRNFVLKTHLDRDVYISAYEIIPGNARVVHHVLLFLDGRHVSPRLDALDPGPGYSSQIGLPGFIPTGSLGGWAPGNSPHVLEDGIVRVLPKGSLVVLQVHYHKSGKVERDRTKFGLYYAKKPPERVASPFVVIPPNFRFGGLRIPPGDPNHEVRASYYLPVDLQALTVTPHMHLLGKDMRITAEMPDGTTIPLLEIKKWDFNWQETYNYVRPVDLPRGTRIDMVAHFDNSAENPNNPSNPPKLVTWGEQTTEEMCIAFFEAVPKAKAASAAELKPVNPYRLLMGNFPPPSKMGSPATAKKD